MSQLRAKPLLFVDIDGVISLWGFDQHAPPAGAFQSIDGILHFLSAGAGNHLLDLTACFEPIWCSGWEEKANEHLPAALGLPGPLEYLSFDRNPGRGHAHWKLAAIELRAGARRPLAWVDDAHDDACAAWADRRDAPTLLITTSPADGLTATHAAQLRAWAINL